jgi:LmbE family N-acetylglucosaminyl deacetylase
MRPSYNVIAPFTFLSVNSPKCLRMRKLLPYLIALIPCISIAQVQPDAAAIKLKLKKLNFLGSVLYVAAHPDDENTRIITYMANDRLAATAYLSMTRGDGGQNLIGPELRDLLGLIRTQELITARKIDGGKQYFTRANDFGFSKSANETFELWGKDEILSDVVRVYRQFQPDVIITRFPPDERAGHGHHTASAVLAQEAFDISNDANKYPELAKEFGTSQPKALYTNTGRWWNTAINEKTPGIITIDVGGYNSLLGQSYSEIAALSRSQHKSQGFGSRGTRGYQPEFLEFIKGEKAAKDVFENVNTTWTRVKGSEKVQLLIDKAIKEFNIENPSASIPVVLQLRKEITALQPGIWRTRKLEEVEQLLQDCTGLFICITASQYWVAPGQKTTTTIEVVNRSESEITLEKIEAPAFKFDSVAALQLKKDVVFNVKNIRVLDSALNYSGPYWLKEKHNVGLFTVNDPSLIGKPDSDPAVKFNFVFDYKGEKFSLMKPLEYKETDPVKGELTQPFEIVPQLFLNLSDPVLIFSSASPREVSVRIKSSSDKELTGNLKLQVPPGWRAEPESIPFTISKRGEEQLKSFKVFPSTVEMAATIQAFAEVNGKIFNRSIQNISYDHIPSQTLLPIAESKVVRLDLKKEGSMIGYINGAGDDIPASLRNMGYQVWMMKDDEVNIENLKRVDAVVLGIRALNTNDRIRHYIGDLLEYVKNGGTLVVQYNTNNNLSLDPFTPFPITLSRNRVTEENAEVRILKPDHPVLNTPNKITPNDFNGWVQERGLYFPEKWNENVEAILSMNDKNEKPQDGSLLIAKYGNGYYVYTGLSFFRELPEGVAGAYKLFANIVSLGKPGVVVETKSKKKTKTKS